MESNPLLNIWFHPRRTVEQLVSENPRLHVLVLAAIAGVAEALDSASSKNLGDRICFYNILAIALFLGPLGGFFSLWLSSHLIRFTGKCLGGEAPREYLRTAIAWAAVPNVAGVVLWIPFLAIAGAEMFTEETPYLESHPLLLIVIAGGGLIQMILGIWSLVLLCNTVAEVQGYRSAWWGLWNLFLAGLLLLIPILMIVLGIALIVG